MRIGVNLLPFRKHLAGGGRFTKNVLENLATIDKENTYFLFLTKQGQTNFQIDADNFVKVFCPITPKVRALRILWEQLILPWQLLSYRIELLFTPTVAIPFWVPCRTITTIHDMIPFHKSIIKYSKLRTNYIRTATNLAIKKSDIIIAVSENTKREIIQFCKVHGEKIIVSLEGVDEKFRKINTGSEIADVRAKNKLPERFILFVGTLEPGKNLQRLIEAYYYLRKENRISHKLVIAGAYGWGNLNLVKENKELILDEIVFTGFVTDDDLCLLYNAADLFVFPSLYEGFGLPPLEAMACGTPVITSNLSSMPEIVGNAAFLVNPYDSIELAAAIEHVLKDEHLRSELTARGRERAKNFSWRKTAEVILQSFNKIENLD